MESSKAIRLLYTLAPYFGQVLFSGLQSEGFEMTVFSLPSARAILPYVDDSEMHVLRTADGILVRSRSSLPFGSLLPSALAPMLMFTTGTVHSVPF